MSEVLRVADTTETQVSVSDEDVRAARLLAELNKRLGIVSSDVLREVADALEVDQPAVGDPIEDPGTKADSERDVLIAAPMPSDYTQEDRAFLEGLRIAVKSERGPRKYDLFISYAQSDGGGVAEELLRSLQKLGLRVWFDREAVVVGRSLSSQIDRGLQEAKAGLVLVTNDYLRKRWWTERELATLMHKPVLIPVLHGVTFEEVTEYSAMLSDVVGFETSKEPLTSIAGKVASAIMPNINR